MRAIVLNGFGGLESLVIKELPDPKPKTGHVLIAVKAFGVNHAETHMRKGEWAEAAEVSGIECVGEVVAAPGGEFQPGDKVAAFMGGMGRTINGSYAELTLVPATNVMKVETDLPWDEFAVIPESYATAWTCLDGNLQIKRGQTLLLRGATSSLGQAALNIAVNAGLNVIATTRNRARFEKLFGLGAHRVEIEGPELSERLPETKKVDVVLDLVGNSTLLDSIAISRRQGRDCVAGWLGGLEPVKDL
jgi:NADPH:quinone reductase